MAPTINELKARFGSSLLFGLVAVNVGVWALLRLAAIVVFLATGADGEFAVCQWVELPAAPVYLSSHWYGIITYMFSQYGVLHLLFNMLWLYWFGRMFLDISTGRQLLALYIYGGLGGAALFLAAYNLLPAFVGTNVWLIGSSASVLAIVTATAVMMPDYPLNLLLLGTVKLKWIAIATIIIVLLSVPGSNTGGEIAHVGGIAVGAFYALMRKRGTDITRPFNTAVNAVVDVSRRVFSPTPRPRKAKRRAAPAMTQSERDRRDLDAILDKIKKSGYGGLTADERKRLFDVSNRIK